MIYDSYFVRGGNFDADSNICVSTIANAPKTFPLSFRLIIKIKS